VPARPGQADIAQNEDRRRFVKAGLIAAPLIVTLTARPAWAQDGVGTTGKYAYATADSTTSLLEFSDPN
jgi:hypothetical protein